MTGFTLPGNQTLNPTYLSYAAYTITEDLVLQWPFQADDDADVLAAKIDVTADAGLGVYFPDASLASVGQDALVYNAGSNTFTVKADDGSTIGSVASGESWYFYLTDNSTTYGTWQSVQFGQGTSSASAASLAGAGLQAVNTLLNQNHDTTTLASTYTINSSDRASVLRNTGGSVTWTFAQCGSATGELSDGWFVYIINSGSGNITLTAYTAQTIDAAATKVLTPTESCAVFSDGSNLWTLGFGQSIATTVSGVSVSVAGSGNTTLSANQIAAQVQDFTGALTGNSTVTYGTGVGYWFVWNNTSGAYTLTARVNGGDAGAAITQGNFSILRSNGTNMKTAFTSTTGTVTSIATTAGQLTGGTITTTGTLGLATTAVTPGTYGDASHTLSATVDAYGRLTALSSVALAITIGQIAVFTSAALYAQVSDPTGAGGSLVFATGPTLSNPVVGTQTAGNNTTLAASTAFVTTAVATLSGSLVNQSTTGPTTQVFAVAGTATYTTPAGVKWIRVSFVGAGGGGGAVGSTTASNGSDGGATIFNSISAAGGGGGKSVTSGSAASAGGAGGSSAGSGSRFSGTDGSYSLIVASGAPTGINSGGDSAFYGGGAPTYTSTGGGGSSSGLGAKTNTGGGGAGGWNSALGIASGGGGGESVEIIINSPSATYNYTVGAKGSKATGTGSGTADGGDGAVGYVIVEEHYNF